MKIYALSDPHLAFSTPEKEMEKFGEVWNDHPTKIKQFWSRSISDNDVVLISGDISWAKKFKSALADLLWLDALPGKKVILKGNHDIWWPKPNVIDKRLLKSIHIIRNNCVQIGKVVFFGTRLWDTVEYSCDEIVKWDPHKGKINRKKNSEELIRQEKIYNRELQRLELSIQSIPVDPTLLKIGVSHFPPLSHELKPTRASQLFSQAGARHVVFGHLHSLKTGGPYFGFLDGIQYHLTSGDYLKFIPKLICIV